MVMFLLLIGWILIMKSNKGLFLLMMYLWSECFVLYMFVFNVIFICVDVLLFFVVKNNWKGNF